MSILGFLIISFTAEGMEGDLNYQDLVLVEKENFGTFTTPYNGSGELIVMAYDFTSCESFQLSITNSSGIEMYNGECYGADINDGTDGNDGAEDMLNYITTINYIEGEVYSFNSSNDLIIEVLYLPTEDPIALVGGLSCCCGIIMSLFGSVLLMVQRSNESFSVKTQGSMPMQTGMQQIPPIQVAPTQTYLSQPTFVEEQNPPSIIISERDSPPQELDLNIKNKEANAKENSDQKSNNFWDEMA